MKITNKYLLFFAGSIIITGIIFIIITICLVSQSFYLDVNNKGLQNAANIGTFIGSFIGPLWALASTILFYVALRYQRDDLELQRIELKSTRQEFEISRLTNIIYKQVEIIDKNLQTFEYNAKRGHKGIESLLYRFKNRLTDSDHKSAEIIGKIEFEQNIIHNYKVLNFDPILLYNLLCIISDNVKTVDSILEVSLLQDDQKKDLKFILARNISGELRTFAAELDMLFKASKDSNNNNIRELYKQLDKNNVTDFVKCITNLWQND